MEPFDPLRKRLSQPLPLVDVAALRRRSRLAPLSSAAPRNAHSFRSRCRTPASDAALSAAPHGEAGLTAQSPARCWLCAAPCRARPA